MTDKRLTLSDEARPRLSVGRVVAPFAALAKSPEYHPSQLTELVHGQLFNIHAEQDGWSYGQVQPLMAGSDRPGYVGWVRTEALTALSEEDLAIPTTHRVSVLSAPVFCRADLKSHIVRSLPLGSRLIVRAEEEGYLLIGSDEWVHTHHVQPVDTAAPDWVGVARLYLGQPYVWGGNGARGVDCSGLVQMSLDACGIDAPRDADMQEKALGHPVESAEIAGDLLFWPGHVGFLSEPGRLLHANATHMGVVEEALEPALERMERAGVRLRAVRRLKER